MAQPIDGRRALSMRAGLDSTAAPEAFACGRTARRASIGGTHSARCGNPFSSEYRRCVRVLGDLPRNVRIGRGVDPDPVDLAAIQISARTPYDWHESHLCRRTVSRTGDSVD